MKTLTQLMVRKVTTEERIESLQYHVTNLTLIGGEGRMALAEQFKEKIEKLEQQIFELNLEMDGL